MQFVSLLILFAKGSLGLQGGSIPFPALREHHKHPLESLDFPFAPGSDGEGNEVLLEPTESYQDITNETLLYLPMVQQFVQEKFATSNDSDSKIRIKYAGWRFSTAKKEILIRFKLLQNEENNIKGLNCALLLNFFKDQTFVFKKATCVPSSEAKCYTFKQDLSHIQINIFNPRRPLLTEIQEVDCYGTRSCISEYSTSKGTRTIYKLGCYSKDLNNPFKTPSFNGSKCSHKYNILENEFRRTECTGALCNDPYYSEITESRIFPVIEHLNQVVQRLESKLENIEAIIRNLN